MRIVVVACVALAYGCGGTSRARDAATTSRCEEVMDDGRRVCVPAGPFLWGIVIDPRSVRPGCDEPSGGCTTCVEDERAAAADRGVLARDVTVGDFIIDRREVSNEEYREFVIAGGTPPPVNCEGVVAAYP